MVLVSADLKGLTHFKVSTFLRLSRLARLRNPKLKRRRKEKEKLYTSTYENARKILCDLTNNNSLFTTCWIFVILIKLFKLIKNFSSVFI